MICALFVMKKKICAKGYKCDTCSFILCDICTSLVLSSHFSNEKHRHSLILMEKKTKCDTCQRYINNFYFHLLKYFFDHLNYIFLIRGHLFLN